MNTKRMEHLDKIAADLEVAILAGRGDVEANRQEWRACQDEMREIESPVVTTCPDCGEIFAEDGCPYCAEDYPVPWEHWDELRLHEDVA